MIVILSLLSLEAADAGEQPETLSRPFDPDEAAARYIQMVNLLAPEEGEIKTMRGGVLPAWKWEIVLRVFTGFDISVDSCGEIKVGPLPEEDYSGKRAWLKLIETRCSVQTFPRELLAVDEVWTHLSGLCTSPSKPRSTTKSVNDPVAMRAIKEGIPRACGLLTIVDYKPTAEVPRVMHIVPWKKSQPDVGPPPYMPSTLLDEVLAPLDRDVFRREVNYYQSVVGEGINPVRTSQEGMQ